MAEMGIELIEISRADASLAQMVALFRAELRALRGANAAPDIEAGRAELEELLAAGLPVYAALLDGERAGYMALRVEGDVAWVEQLYVRPECRRRGVASALHRRAEELAGARGGDAVYNWVHPNNHRMIAFLRARGYTVLNLIEIRRPRPGERCGGAIAVGAHEFDY